MSIPFIGVGFFLFKGMDLLPSLFYGMVLLLIFLMANRNVYWLLFDNELLKIKYFNIFKADTSINYDQIIAIEVDDGELIIDPITHGIIGIPEFLRIVIEQNGLTDSVLIRGNSGVNLSKVYNQLIEFTPQLKKEPL